MSHKDRQRERIRRQTDEFLARGGRISRVSPGTSGEDARSIRAAAMNVQGSRSERTYVPEVIAAIESRKQAMKKKTRVQQKTRRGPRRKLVYDDFGEPLRWEWVD